jgi:quinol monooxygenase YgiN
MPVVAVADMFGLSGRRDELIAVLGDAERVARTKPGCRRYAFAAAIAEADRFTLFSEWDDQATLEAHYASPEFASFQFALQGLLARPSEMTVYAVNEATRPLPSRPMDPRDAD